MCTLKELAEEIDVDVSTVRRAVYKLWGTEESMEDVTVPMELVPASTKSILSGAAAAFKNSTLPDLRFRGFAELTGKKCTAAIAGKIAKPEKVAVKTETGAKYTYVFTDEQANLIRCYLVPDRLEAVQAVAVLSTQVQLLQDVVSQLSMLAAATQTKLLDQRKLLDYDKQLNVAYERALDEKHKMRSQLQELLNSWAAN